MPRAVKLRRRRWRLSPEIRSLRKKIAEKSLEIARLRNAQARIIAGKDQVKIGEPAVDGDLVDVYVGDPEYTHWAVHDDADFPRHTQVNFTLTARTAAAFYWSRRRLHDLLRELDGVTMPRE